MPARDSLLGDGEDVPLFGDWEQVEQRPEPKAETTERPYAGPRTTCFQCAIDTNEGRVRFERQFASWVITLPAGYRWLICGAHKMDWDSGDLALTDPAHRGEYRKPRPRA